MLSWEMIIFCWRTLIFLRKYLIKHASVLAHLDFFPVECRLTPVVTPWPRRSQILPPACPLCAKRLAKAQQTQMHVTLPCIKTEPNDLFKYSRLLGIFLTKFAAEVESNITSATFNGIPTGFRGLSRTSCLGNTCMWTSVFFSPELVTTSTRMKSASIDALPLKRPRDGRKNKRKMANGMNDSHQCDNSPPGTQRFYLRFFSRHISFYNTVFA